MTHGSASRIGIATGWAVGAKAVAVIIQTPGNSRPVRDVPDYEGGLTHDTTPRRAESITVARPCRNFTGFRPRNDAKSSIVWRNRLSRDREADRHHTRFASKFPKWL